MFAHCQAEFFPKFVSQLTQKEAVQIRLNHNLVIIQNNNKPQRTLWQYEFSITKCDIGEMYFATFSWPTDEKPQRGIFPGQWNGHSEDLVLICTVLYDAINDFPQAFEWIWDTLSMVTCFCLAGEFVWFKCEWDAGKHSSLSSSAQAWCSLCLPTELHSLNHALHFQ